MHLSVDELRRRMLRRARWHDYSRPSTYLITITKDAAAPVFAELNNPSPDRYGTTFTPAGRLISRHIYALPEFAPGLQVWRFVIMPDHIHLLLRVSQQLDRHIGSFIGQWKSILTTLNHDAPLLSIGYHDRISLTREQTLRMRNYIDDNPRRAWIKRANPHLFTTITTFNLLNGSWSMMGNRFLLHDPLLVSVRARRAFTSEQLAKAKEHWRRAVDNGGVLVGAFISPHERELLNYAIDEGGSVIIITPEAMGPRFKPQGRLFDLCAEGRLLLIAPVGDPLTKVTMTRPLAAKLNQLADSLASYPPILTGDP